MLLRFFLQDLKTLGKKNVNCLNTLDLDQRMRYMLNGFTLKNSNR